MHTVCMCYDLIEIKFLLVNDKILLFHFKRQTEDIHDYIQLNILMLNEEKK